MVTIAGIQCSIVSASLTQITCLTGSCTIAAASITASVLVYIKNIGFASNVSF